MITRIAVGIAGTLIAILFVGCAGDQCMTDVVRPPFDAGTEPNIVIDQYDLGRGYAYTDPDGCITGRVFNVDYSQVVVRVLLNGWPQPWMDSVNGVDKDGIWYANIRHGERVEVILLSKPGYLPGVGTPYAGLNGNYRVLATYALSNLQALLTKEGS